MDAPDVRPARSVVRIAAAALAAVVFVLYLLTLAWAPVPGAPAALIVKHAGLSEIPPLVHPVWNGLCHLLAVIPWGSLAILVHVACALLAAAAVGLLVAVVARLSAFRPIARPAGPADEDAPPRPAAEGADAEPLLRAAAGVLAGLFLALSAPFWLAATRASTYGLEVALMLLAVLLLLRYLDTGRRSTLLPAAWIWGLAAAESPAVILASPLLLVLAGLGMVRHRQIPDLLHSKSRKTRDGWTLAAAVLCWLAGFLPPLVLAAVRFARSPASEWMGMESGWAVALATVRAVYGGVLEAVPQVGWILHAAISVVPAILYAWARARPPHLGAARFAWTCLLLSLFGAALVLNAPFAPWPLFGGQTPPVMPYLWIAAWSALSVSALLRLLLRAARRKNPDAVFPASLRSAAGLAVAVALVAGILNFRHADGRDARPFGWFAAGVAEEAEGAEWILSRGLWDDIVLLAARRREPPLQTVRWNLARQDTYLAWLGSCLASAPRLAGLCPAGLQAVVPAWMASTSTPPRSVTALDIPEVFTASGIDPVPGFWLYHLDTNAAPSGVSHAGRALDRWRTAAAAMRKRVERAEFPLREYGRLALRHAGRVMNDRGVFLEDAGRAEDAIRAYTAALDANPSNLVARINLSRVVRTLGRLETARIDASLVRYIEEMPGPVDIVDQTNLDGVLRDPAVLTARGLRRSAAGDAGLAVSDLLASLSLGASNDVAAAAAVRVLVSQGRSGEAALILEEAAARMPDSDILRMARSHMALAGHDPDAAERAMASTDPADPRRRLTAVLVALARDDWKGADALVRDLLKESPTNTEAVALSAVTGLRLGQPARVRAAAATLQAAGQRHPLVSISLAALLLDEKRTEEARQILEGLLVHQPHYRPARDLLIRMDQAAGRTASMRDHIFEILRQNPDDPMANLQLAAWQGDAGRFDLAEAALRTVLAQRRAPIVLNNLAWALRQQGKAAEAVSLAEEAVRGNPGLASGWDTLAVALADLGRSKEAVEAVEKAAKLDPSSRAIRDHADALRAGRPIRRPAP